MRNLVRFIAHYGHVFTWLVLAILSIILLFQRNPYHQTVWLSSANVITGSMYEATSNVTSYFGLRSINEDLLIRTGQLEAENLRLKQILRKYEDIELHQKDTVSAYSYTIAHVVKNSINHAENYITLDKGSADGIKQDQGVADQNGVVGIVSRVSEHYALVISLLNPKLRLSVALKNNDSYGSLWWDGNSVEHALLEDLPRTVKFEKGDTVVTTSYSASFPQGIPVGTVEDSYETDNNSFLTLRIKLFTDFDRINSVHVIDNAEMEEIKLLNQIEEHK